MGFLDWFLQKLKNVVSSETSKSNTKTLLIEVSDANVLDDWGDSQEWRLWDPPLNIVRGESFRQKNLQQIAGKPRANGYLVPVRVTLVREPYNEHDSNAVRVEIEGLHIGYIAKEFARILSQIMDTTKILSYNIAGVIRGGSFTAPTLGVHIWLDRRLSRGPVITKNELISGMLSSYKSPWPPYENEGIPNESNSNSVVFTSLSFPQRDKTEKPGYYLGKYYTEYVETVKQLKKIKEYQKTEQLLLALIEAVESESIAKNQGVAPWYYEQLAIIYRKTGDLKKELEILERFTRQKLGPGAQPPKFFERLEKVRQKLASNN